MKSKDAGKVAAMVSVDASLLAMVHESLEFKVSDNFHAKQLQEVVGEGCQLKVAVEVLE